MATEREGEAEEVVDESHMVEGAVKNSEERWCARRGEVEL